MRSFPVSTLALASVLGLGAIFGAACNDSEAVTTAGPDAAAEATPDPTSSNPILPLSPAAKIGFDESPFPIDTHGMPLEQQEQIGLGSYIVNTQSDCKGCHGHLKPGGLPIMLGGGVRLVIGASDGHSAAIVYSRNLTSDPVYGLKLTEAEFIETMRTGKDFRYPGQQLLVMPWFAYRWMSDQDLKAIYAYLKLVPADPYPVPDDLKGSFAALEPVPFTGMYTDGDVARPLGVDDVADVGHQKRGLAIEPRVSPAAFATMTPEDQARYARGSYLVNAVADCNQCHTEPQRDMKIGSATYLKINTANYFAGGRLFDVPADLFQATLTIRTQCSNLTGTTNGVFKNFTLADFQRIIEQKVFISTAGKERALRFPMFLQPYTRMTEDDIVSVYTYVKAQEAVSGAADKPTQPPARYCEKAEECAAGETCDLKQNQCFGRACTTTIDCDACQTCSGAKKCALPSATSACVFRSGIMY